MKPDPPGLTKPLPEIFAKRLAGSPHESRPGGRPRGPQENHSHSEARGASLAAVVENGDPLVYREG